MFDDLEGLEMKLEVRVEVLFPERKSGHILVKGSWEGFGRLRRRWRGRVSSMPAVLAGLGNRNRYAIVVGCPGNGYAVEKMAIEKFILQVARRSGTV